MSTQFDLSGTSVVDRFLRYVKIHTSSKDDAECYPSTSCQFDLARLLVEELKGLGLSDATVDQNCYVTATLESNLPHGEASRVPVIAFIAHMDTYPGVSGEGVKPVVHRSYGGGDIRLPGDSNQVLGVAENPELLDFVGDDIITSDGTTLLGADDKAGVAEIMAALEYAKDHPEFRHGRVRVAFTPDEEVGAGTKHFDVAAFGAHYGYTMDGGSPGEVENETFCADGGLVRFVGKDVHPGYAKNKMVNAVRAAARFVTLFRPDALPETTAGRQGYIHPIQVEGNVSEAKVHLLLRDFEVEGLEKHKAWLEKALDLVRAEFPGVGATLEVKESYRNMIYQIRAAPEVMECAEAAIVRAGLEPIRKAIRGGTDGARLSFMGLPTPNIFAGGMNFHSKLEWVAAGAMRKAVETILHLVEIWRDRPAGA